MKPSWKDAPKWANYLAMDDDGRWYWYETKPMISSGAWYSHANDFAVCEIAGWKDSLESRP